MTDDRVTPLTGHRLDRIVDMLNEAINRPRFDSEQDRLLEIHRLAGVYQRAFDDCWEDSHDA